MDAAAPREREGYVEDVARAVAAVLRRRPVVSAAVLGAGIAITATDWFWLDPALFRAWVTSAAFLAGGALGGSRPVLRGAGTTGRWVVAAMAVLVVVDVLLVRSAGGADGV